MWEVEKELVIIMMITIIIFTIILLERSKTEVEFSGRRGMV